MPLFATFCSKVWWLICAMSYMHVFWVKTQHFCKEAAQKGERMPYKKKVFELQPLPSNARCPVFSFYL